MKSVITKTGVSFLKAPLNQPFRTALGTHDRLENLLFTLALKDGTKGYGEAAIATHITGETLQETSQNLKSIGEELRGYEAGNYLRLSARLRERLPRNKSAIAAVEMAVMDALTRQWKIPLWKFFGPKPRRLASDITIVIADLAETEAAVKKYYRQGFRAFKVKIGRDEESDFQRVLGVKRLAPGGKIYLDANQGYTAKRMLQFLKRIGRAGIRPALLEQPVPKADWEGLKEVARLSPCPVCADESIRSLADAVRAIREKAVPVINIKLMKCGLFEAREIALASQAAGMKLMAGGMMESSLAMTAAAHLAAGLGGFDFIDLDTPFFIKGGLQGNPYLNKQGVYDVRKVKAGIGIVP